MEKFLLLIREDLEELGRLSTEERNAFVQEMSKWVASLAESWNYLSGEALQVTGKYVRKHEVLSDGPFIEAKEGISGFILITAENIDQAASLAQTCPLVARGMMAIEVRPLLAYNQ